MVRLQPPVLLKCIAIEFLNFLSVTKNFIVPPPTPQYSHRVNQVLDEKKRRRWVQDSDKRKVQISKENFYPVLPGRSRKEVAAQWFKELAGYKTLSTLSKKVKSVCHENGVHS